MNLLFLHYAQMGAKKKASGSAPSNEIWYTSTDGNIVKPYSTSAFNVSIVSNTYTDGKGVITFNGDVTKIGASAFLDRTNLASITLPEGLMTIERDAFYYCERLASINIPEGVTTIGTEAFYKCTSLASITLPDSLTTIGANAFRNCSSLHTAYSYPKNPPAAGSGIFSGVASGFVVYVPTGSESAYKAATNWSGYTIQGF